MLESQTRYGDIICTLSVSHGYSFYYLCPMGIAFTLPVSDGHSLHSTGVIIMGIACTLPVLYGHSFHSTGVIRVYLALYRCHMGIVCTLPVIYGYSLHSTGVIRS